MTRVDVILKVDQACAALEEALDMLYSMGAEFTTLPGDIRSVVHELEKLRVYVYSADLPNESEEQ